MAAVAEAQVPTTTTSGSTTPESSAQTPLTPQQKLQQAKDARDQAKKSGDKEALKAAKDQVKQARAEVKNPLLNDDRYLELHRQVAVGREQMRHEQPVVLTILKSPAEAILYRRTVDRLWQAMQSNPNLGDPPLVTTDMVREASRRGKVAFNELTLRDQAKAVNAREQLRKIAQEAGMDPVAEAVKSDPAAKAFLEGIQQKVLGQELNADLIRDYKIGEVSEQDRADRYAREIKALSDANGQNLDDAGARQLAEGLIIMAQGMREAGFVMHDNIRSDATELAFKDMLQKNLTPEQRLLYQQLVGVSESRSVIAKLQGGKAVGLMGAGFVTGLMHVPGVNAGVLLAGGAAMGVWSAYKRVQYDELMYKINESRGIHKETGDRNLLQKAFSADWNSIDTSHDRKIAYARIITTSALVSVASFGLGRFIHNPDDFVQWIHQSYEGIKDTAGNLIHGMDATQHITLSSMPQTTEAGMFGTPAMPNTMKGFLDTFTGHTGTGGSVDTSHLTTGGSGEATQGAVQQAGHLDTNHLTAVTAHGPAIPKVVDHPGPHQGQVDQYLLDRQRAIVDAQHANAAHLQSVDQQNDLRFAEGDKPITLKTFDADLTKFQHETDPIKLNADWMRLQADMNMLHNPQLTQHFNDLLANPAAKGTLTAEDFIKLHQEVSFLEDQPILHNISADIAKLQAAMDAHDFKTQDSILEQIREQARQLHDSQQKSDILNQINAIKRPSSLWPDRLPTNADIQHLKTDVAALEPPKPVNPADFNGTNAQQANAWFQKLGQDSKNGNWLEAIKDDFQFAAHTGMAKIDELRGIGSTPQTGGAVSSGGAAGAATAAGQHTADTAASTIPNGTGGSTNAHELFGQPTGHENVVYEGNMHNSADFTQHYGTDATDARLGTWQGAHTAYDANGKWVEFYGTKPGSVMEIHMNNHVYTFPSGMRMSLTDNDPSHGVTLTPVGGGQAVHMTQQQFLTMVGYGNPKTIQAGNIVNATYQEWAKLHGVAGTGNASDRLAQAVDPAWLAKHPGFKDMLDHNLAAHKLTTHDIHWTAVKMGEAHLDGDTIKIDAENQDVDQSQFQNNLPAPGTGGPGEAGENFTAGAARFDSLTDKLPFGDDQTDAVARLIQTIQENPVGAFAGAAVLIGGANVLGFFMGRGTVRTLSNNGARGIPGAIGRTLVSPVGTTAVGASVTTLPWILLGTPGYAVGLAAGVIGNRRQNQPAQPAAANQPQGGNPRGGIFNRNRQQPPPPPPPPPAAAAIPLAQRQPNPVAPSANPFGLNGNQNAYNAVQQVAGRQQIPRTPRGQQAPPPPVRQLVQAAAFNPNVTLTDVQKDAQIQSLLNGARGLATNVSPESFGESAMTAAAGAPAVDLTNRTNAEMVVAATGIDPASADAARLADGVQRAAIIRAVAAQPHANQQAQFDATLQRIISEVEGGAATPEHIIPAVRAMHTALNGNSSDIQRAVNSLPNVAPESKAIAAAALADIVHATPDQIATDAYMAVFPNANRRPLTVTDAPIVATIAETLMNNNLPGLGATINDKLNAVQDVLGTTVQADIATRARVGATLADPDAGNMLQQGLRLLHTGVAGAPVTMNDLPAVVEQVIQVAAARNVATPDQVFDQVEPVFNNLYPNTPPLFGPVNGAELAARLTPGTPDSRLMAGLHALDVQDPDFAQHVAEVAENFRAQPNLIGGVYTPENLRDAMHAAFPQLDNANRSTAATNVWNKFSSLPDADRLRYSLAVAGIEPQTAGQQVSPIQLEQMGATLNGLPPRIPHFADAVGDVFGLDSQGFASLARAVAQRQPGSMEQIIQESAYFTLNENASLQDASQIFKGIATGLRARGMQLPQSAQALSTITIPGSDTGKEALMYAELIDPVTGTTKAQAVMNEIAPTTAEGVAYVAQGLQAAGETNDNIMAVTSGRGVNKEDVARNALRVAQNSSDAERALLVVLATKPDETNAREIFQIMESNTLPGGGLQPDVIRVAMESAKITQKPVVVKSVLNDLLPHIPQVQKQGGKVVQQSFDAQQDAVDKAVQAAVAAAGYPAVGKISSTDMANLRAEINALLFGTVGGSPALNSNISTNIKINIP